MGMTSRRSAILALALFAVLATACAAPQVTPVTSLPDPEGLPVVTVYREPT